MPFGLGARFFFRTATRPHGRPWWATPRNRWNDAETTALQHGRRPWRTAATTWSPSADSRRRTPAIDGGVAQTCRRWTDGGPRDGHGRDLPEAWNRIKASLSVFQCWEVKVLGFGVKDRPRPQRMALRGIRALTSRCEPAEDATAGHDRYTAPDRGLRSH